MKKLIWYRPGRYFKKFPTQIKEPEKMDAIYKIIGENVSIVDRTNTLPIPIDTVNLYPIPRFTNINETYEELCKERVLELLTRSDVLKTRIAVMYSGGIDSTLILVLFLNYATKEQLKNIDVFLNEESINENKRFYDQYIIKNFNIESSLNFKSILGDRKYLIITGENNDQIFGAGKMSHFVNYFGFEKLMEKYSKDAMLSFYNKMNPNRERNELAVAEFEKICRKAPVKIVSNFDFMWWIQFSLVWQHIFLFFITFVPPHKKNLITKEYLDNHYTTFFNTEKFQLWSMNNLDKRVKDSWNTYKYPAKEIIYNFTKDEDYYKNKVKLSSTGSYFHLEDTVSYIDQDYNIE